MTKYIVSVVLAIGLILSVIGLSMKVSEQQQMIDLKNLEIESLKETQSAIIDSYEEDIAEREKKAKNRKYIVKEIVKVVGNEKCINDPISPTIIERLQYKPTTKH